GAESSCGCPHFASAAIPLTIKLVLALQHTGAFGGGKLRVEDGLTSSRQLGRVHNQHDGAPAAIFSYMDSSHYASHGRQTAETGCVRIYGLVGESSLQARS